MYWCENLDVLPLGFAASISHGALPPARREAVRKSHYVVLFAVKPVCPIRVYYPCVGAYSLIASLSVAASVVAEELVRNGSSRATHQYG